MDVREDYTHFSIENSDILDELKEHSTITYDYIEPLILVLDHLIKVDFQIKGETRDTIEDIFNTGFRYLYNLVETIRNILDENFDGEIEELISFDQNLYLYLRCDELDSMYEGKNETISGILDNIDNSFVYKRRFDDQAIELIEGALSDAESRIDEPTVVDQFMDICDALNIDII